MHWLECATGLCLKAPYAYVVGIAKHRHLVVSQYPAQAFIAWVQLAALGGSWFSGRCFLGGCGLLHRVRFGMYWLDDGASERIWEYITGSVHWYKPFGYNKYLCVAGFGLENMYSREAMNDGHRTWSMD